MATIKITAGKSFSRAVEYDLGNGLTKDEQEKIKLLPATADELIAEGFKEGRRARILAANIPGETVSELAGQFNRVAAHKPDKKEPVHKVSISLKPGEHLSTAQWLEVGHSYLREMGYSEAPHLIVQHREKEHEHIHIVTAKVDFNGDVVSDSFERKRARTWAQQIEKKYRLHETAAKAEEKGLTRVEIEQALKNKTVPPKLVLQTRLRQTLEKYPQTVDFLAALEKQQITVKVRFDETQEVRGISFGFAGRAYKGSSLGRIYTWQGLQQHGLHYEHQRDFTKLEEASRRASRTGDGRADRTSVGERNDQAIGSGDSDARGITVSAEFSGGESLAGSQSHKLGGETQSNESAVESIPLTAGAEESLPAAGNGTTTERSQSEFRRVGKFGQRKIETAERIEPTPEEAIAAEAGEDSAGINFAVGGEQAPSETFAAERSAFESEQQLLELFNFLSTAELSTIQPTNDATLGAGNVALSTHSIINDVGAGSRGVELPDAGNHHLLGRKFALDAFSTAQSDLDGNQIDDVSVSSFPGNNDVFAGDRVHLNRNTFPLLGDSVVADGTARSAARSLMAENLLKSLQQAEAVCDTTFSLADEVAAHEAAREKEAAQNSQEEEQADERENEMENEMSERGFRLSL